MNSLAKNSQKSPFDPLLYAWKSLFFENPYTVFNENRDTADLICESPIFTNCTMANLMSYNYHYTTYCVIVFRPIRIDSEIVLHQLRIFLPVEAHS